MINIETTSKPIRLFWTLPPRAYFPAVQTPLIQLFEEENTEIKLAHKSRRKNKNFLHKHKLFILEQVNVEFWRKSAERTAVGCAGYRSRIPWIWNESVKLSESEET